MLTYFDDAPPTIVKRFARIMNYESARLESQYLPDWCRQHRTRSII